MDGSARVAATIVVWLAFIAVVGLIAHAVTNSGGDVNLGGIIVILIVVLSVLEAVKDSTKAIWSGQKDREAANASGKTKRRDRSRVERLIQDLDDEDIYDLEALLLARDDVTTRQQ